MNDGRTRILILDDEPLVSASLVRAIRAANPAWLAIEAVSPTRALEHVIAENVSVFICAQELHGDSGTEILAQARSLAPETVGILTMSHLDVTALLDCVNIAGAFRCLAKPFPAMRLLPEIAEAIVESERRAALQTMLRAVHRAA